MSETTSSKSWYNTLTTSVQRSRKGQRSAWDTPLTAAYPSMLCPQVANDVEKEMEAPPTTDLSSFQETITLKLDEVSSLRANHCVVMTGSYGQCVNLMFLTALLKIRKLRETLLYSHPLQDGPSLPTHPSCGFVMDMTVVKQAISFLISLHTEELVPGAKVSVNVVGTVSPRGSFWLRLVAEDCGVQEVMLQNVSLAMRYGHSTFCTCSSNTHSHTPPSFLSLFISPSFSLLHQCTHTHSLELTRSSPPPLPSPQPGQLCCAQYSADQHWYRARIESIPKPGVVRLFPSHYTPHSISLLPPQASVYFLDYGSSEAIPFVNIYPLSEQFQVYPFQMIQCCFTEDTGLLFDKREVRGF